MKQNFYKFLTKHIYLLLILSTFFIVINLYFGSILNIQDLKTTAIYRGLNNEIFYHQLINFNKADYLQNSIFIKNYDKFFLNNLSIPLFYIQALIFKITNNIQLGINIFVIIGFILTTLCSFSVFRLLESTKLISAFFAILFSFTYYQQYENSVINTSWYGLSLYFVYYCIYFLKTNDLTKNNQYYYILYIYCFFNAFINLQFALLGWFLILSTIVILKFIQKKSIPRLLAILPLIFLIQIYITYQFNLHFFNFDQNNGLSFSEIENYQFKITQLFLPNINHHIKLLADISNTYQQHYILNNDNNIASLGFLSSFILFYILLKSIYYSFNKNSNENSLDLTIQQSFVLIVFILTLTTTGSLSAFISYQNPAFMLEWFRASIFINFICFIVLVAIFNHLAKNLKYKYFIVLLITVFSFGFYDQSPRHSQSDKHQLIKENSDINQIISYINSSNINKDTNYNILVLPINNLSANKDFARKNLFIQNRLQNSIRNLQSTNENILITMSHLNFNEQINFAAQQSFKYLIIDKNNYCNFKKLNINLLKIIETDNFNLYQFDNHINSSPMELKQYLTYKINTPPLLCYP